MKSKQVFSCKIFCLYFIWAKTIIELIFSLLPFSKNIKFKSSNEGQRTRKNVIYSQVTNKSLMYRSIDKKLRQPFSFSFLSLKNSVEDQWHKCSLRCWNVFKVWLNQIWHALNVVTGVAIVPKGAANNFLHVMLEVKVW